MSDDPYEGTIQLGPMTVGLRLGDALVYFNPAYPPENLSHWEKKICRLLLEEALEMLAPPAAKKGFNPPYPGITNIPLGDAPLGGRT